jgi:tRNA nucleotidyltransferase (CCA-adding enzyme)
MKIKVKTIKTSIPRDIIELAQRFKQAGFSFFVVGGSIRNILLKKPAGSIGDFDLATDATPDEILTIFPDAIPTGLKFGTLTIRYEGRQFETTTFRKDGRYLDGRHPAEVNYTKKLADDLGRRDFTINALAYDPLTTDINDLYNGLEDLQAGIIRAVGDPLERFQEDGLRGLRACRLASQLNFQIEPATFSAIAQARPVFEQVSPERIREELLKILASPQPSMGLELMRQAGLLEVAIPELLEGHEMSQNKFHTHDVYYHALFACDQAPVKIRLAALLHDIAKPACRTPEGKFYNHDNVGKQMAGIIMHRLKFSNKDIEYAGHLIENHMFYYLDEWTDAAVRRFVKRVGPDFLDDLYDLRMADVADSTEKAGSLKALEKLKKRIRKLKAREAVLSLKELVVNGQDIMGLGVAKGPEVGKLLNHLLEMVINHPRKNKRELLLAEAKRVIREKEELE